MDINVHLPNFVDKFGGSINITLINLLKNYPQMFYDRVKIASVFDSFPLIWNGGRMMIGYMDENTVKQLVPQYLHRFNSLGIPCRMTFTNPMLTKEHLSDKACNAVLDIADNGMNEVIVFSPLLEEHIRKTHPNMKITSSTCKQIRDITELNAELEKDYKLVVLDYNFNNDFESLSRIMHRDKCEILVNAVCTPNCSRRGEHYRYIGKYQLEHCTPDELMKIKSGTARIDEWKCPHMHNNAFTVRKSPLHVSPDAIFGKYAHMGFVNFKLEGRGNSFADLIEQYTYYFAKPEYRDNVRYALNCTAAAMAGSGRTV